MNNDIINLINNIQESFEINISEFVILKIIDSFRSDVDFNNQFYNENVFAIDEMKFDEYCYSYDLCRNKICNF